MNAAVDSFRVSARSRPFRLLVVSSDTYPPQRVDVSVLFGEELAGRGHRIDWILQSEAECRRGYVADWGGGRVWVAPADRGNSLFRRIRKHVMGIVHDARLFGLMRTGQYDAIEVKDKFLTAVLALIAARRNRKRFIYWLSFPLPEFYLARARDGTAPYPLLYRIRGAVFQFLLYRLLLPRADHIFVQSEQMRRDVAAHGIALARLTAVPMGVRTGNLPQHGASTPRQLIAPGEPCFLYLGSLNKERRLDFLLRVLARVRAEIPAARLYLIGKAELAEDEAFLLAEARRNGLEGALVFKGQLPQAEAFRYVQEADVCVSPFYPSFVLNSTSPTKLVEYMALGKAVVGNTHPEQKLLIEESGCGYCVPWQEQAFADAIVRLLRAPDLVRAMGERGRQYVLEHRGYARIADLVEHEMLRIAAGNPP
ncbi:MAG TPA: glycosyltransferase family 4 protein [Steroidobacteraceae bacterium]|nr:glycosyltransferase family 4 protein [Steroidobacteraceae bacterium]